MTDETSQPAGEPPAAASEPATSAPTEPIAAQPIAGQPVVAKPDENDVAAPTQANPVAAAAAAVSPPVAPPPAATPPVATPPAAPAPVAPDRPAGIFVPKWVGVVAAAIIAALVFGAIGYAIGDSSSGSDSSRGAVAFPGGRNRTGNGGFGTGQLPNGGQLPGNSGNGFPQFPGNGNGNSGNGNGNGGSGSAGGGQTASNAGFLGVAVTSADNGVTISDVQSGSPAANAGLQKGDVITAVDDTKVTTTAALATVIHGHSSGDQVTVTYTRNGTSNTAKVTLTSRSTAQSS
jgi:membrane-associated protease RseP (regulator of RpoE activity)